VGNQSTSPCRMPEEISGRRGIGQAGVEVIYVLGPWYSRISKTKSGPRPRWRVGSPATAPAPAHRTQVLWCSSLPWSVCLGLPSVCLLSVCLSVCRSVCLSAVCLSTVCLYVCLYLHPIPLITPPHGRIVLGDRHVFCVASCELRGRASIFDEDEDEASMKHQA
jgi:hypothetical protein